MVGPFTTEKHCCKLDQSRLTHSVNVRDLSHPDVGVDLRAILDSQSADGGEHS